MHIPDVYESNSAVLRNKNLPGRLGRPRLPAELGRRPPLGGSKGASETTVAGEAAISGDEANGKFGFHEQSPGILKLALKDCLARRPTRGRLVPPAEVPL
jgi:hypothetical protein